MPHGLFTRHAKPRFLAIHHDLLDICDGQHCEAALLTEIEFICCSPNVSSPEMSANAITAAIADQPIFRISLAQLEERIFHLYKSSRIRVAMEWLTKRGFLRTESKTESPGIAKIWALDVETVDEALRRTAVFPLPLQKSMGTPTKREGSLKEEEVDSLQTVKDPPNPLNNLPSKNYRLENISASPQPPTPEDAGLNTNKSLKVNLDRIAKHLKFPLNSASLRQQRPTLDRRYKKAHEAGEAEEYLADLLKACSEFNVGEMQGDVLIYCEQQTRDKWRVTSCYGGAYNGTQTTQDPKQSCSAFALRVADILEAAGSSKSESYRAASTVPDWKMSQIEATAAGMADFQTRAAVELKGKDLSAGGALEMIYRKFGNVQTPKMSSIEHVIATYGDEEE